MFVESVWESVWVPQAGGGAWLTDRTGQDRTDQEGQTEQTGRTGQTGRQTDR